MKILFNKKSNEITNQRNFDFIISKFLTVFDGLDALAQMIKFINASHKKYQRNIPGSKKTVMVKTRVYLYAHNAKGFDNYLMLQTPDVQFSNIVNKNGISKLDIECENVIIECKCTMSHLPGSLKKLCGEYGVPAEYSKSEMDHGAVTAETWESLKPVWLPYLKLDVMSLAIVWYKYT